MATELKSVEGTTEYTSFKVLSTVPFVTISAPSKGYPAGVGSIASDIVGDLPALHLVHPSWTMDSARCAAVAEGIERAQADAPNSQFLLLASNDIEAMAFRRTGGDSIIGNGLIFTDERVWRPLPPSTSLPTYDAVYVARLDPWKRHELATAIETLLLVYTRSQNMSFEDALARARRLLPRATFANHDFTGGTYEQFNADRVATLLAQARVGLCLSETEGCMRAAMEYLLCGLPLVSTKSVGGRDRYFGVSYCRIVDRDNPDTVAAATRDLMSMGLDRRRIRAHVEQVLAFERYNFLLALNAVVRKQFGLGRDLFSTIEPFLGSVGRYFSASEMRVAVTKAVQMPKA